MAQKTDPKKEKKTGFEALVESKMFSQRFPLLEVLFKNFGRLVAKDLTSIIPDVGFEVECREVVTDHFETYFTPLVKETFVCGSFIIKEWNDSGVLMCDLSTLTRLVKMMLGALNEETSVADESKKEKKPEKKGPTKEKTSELTPVETYLGNKIFTILSASVAKIFEPVQLMDIAFERMEFHSKPDLFIYPMPCVIGVFFLKIAEKEYPLYLVLPYGTMQPMRDLLSGHYLGEKMGKDTLWKEHVSEEVKESHTKIKAVLGEVFMPLRKIFTWEKGTTFLLNVTPDSLIDLYCHNTILFKGRIGRQGGLMAFSIDHSFLEHEKESLS